MGVFAQELAQIAGSPGYELESRSQALSRELDGAGSTVKRTAADPGLSGQSADAAAELLERQGRGLLRNSDTVGQAGHLLGRADAALADAAKAAKSMPAGFMSSSIFDQVVGGAWVLLGPFGAFSGLAGAQFVNAVLDFNREQYARPIVLRLQSELGHLATALSRLTEQLEIPAGATPRILPEFPLDRAESQITPWELGVEWLGGEGNSREFFEGDDFTELLRQHPHYQDTLADLSSIYNQLFIGWEGSSNYRLRGVEGVVKYIEDYSTLLTGGLTGNLAVTFLGSHTVGLEVIGQRPDGGYEVRVTASNASSLQSATRPPVIGYQEWYMSTVGEATNQFSEATGIGRTTEQTITWTETIYP
ncbi:MAG: hypothetical protein KF680_09980 [Cryobacterium sp.]|nr:hypothetical protein [Cryobacterium sp.]